MDVANKEALYVVAPMIGNTNTLSEYEYSLNYSTFEANPASATLLSPIGDATDTGFVWAGTFGRFAAAGGTTYDLSVPFSEAVVDITAISPIAYNTGIYMHKDHPDLDALYSDYAGAAVDSTVVTESEMKENVQTLINNAIYTMPITANIETGAVYSIYNPAAAQSISGGANAKKQLGYMKMDNMIAAGDRSFKMSFDANDQYLLGGRSCGAFLFMAPNNISTLSVDGDNKQGTKKIAYGDNNSVSVDIVFQYRMTDYAGNDPSTDIGRVGGFAKLAFSNLTYTKVLGIDIFDKFDSQFTFDLEVFARYAPKGKNLSSIRAAQLIR
jgi:hypothetical protein